MRPLISRSRQTDRLRQCSDRGGGREGTVSVGRHAKGSEQPWWVLTSRCLGILGRWNPNIFFNPEIATMTERACLHKRGASTHPLVIQVGYVRSWILWYGEHEANWHTRPTSPSTFSPRSLQQLRSCESYTGMYHLPEASAASTTVPVAVLDTVVASATARVSDKVVAPVTSRVSSAIMAPFTVV